MASLLPYGPESLSPTCTPRLNVRELGDAQRMLENKQHLQPSVEEGLLQAGNMRELVN